MMPQDGVSYPLPPMSIWQRIHRQRCKTLVKVTKLANPMLQLDREYANSEAIVHPVSHMRVCGLDQRHILKLADSTMHGDSHMSVTTQSTCEPSTNQGQV